MNSTLCISCGQPMAPGAERPVSMGNPNQCVPCATGHHFPRSQESARSDVAEPGSLLRRGKTSLPPATAPELSPNGQVRGTETTRAGGNPFPAGRWTNLVRGCGPTEPAAGTASKPAEIHSVGSGQLCIKCGAPIDPGLATVCCADCRAGFRVHAPRLPEPAWDEASEALTLELRRKGIVSIPADTHNEHAWRMML